MSSNSSQDEFTKKRLEIEALVKKQADLVCDLKAAGDATKPETLSEAVAKLKDLKDEQKKLIKSFTSQFESERAPLNREDLEDLLKRRFFYTPAFEIYNGVKGLYDLGPPGCAVQAAIVAQWRQTFVVNEDILELDCTCMTPKIVLDVSGHTEKFCDFLVTSKSGDECVRADHLLEDWIDKRLENENITADQESALRVARARADEMSQAELYEALKTYYVPTATTAKAKKPKAGEPEKKYDDEWQPPKEFNLMFGTSIGPSGNAPGFLRPETAQGMFVNFRRLLDYAQNKLPFGAAQIGKAFRNEINPRSGLLRVREFLLAEVEFFVHPRRHLHDRFHEVADVPMRLFGRDSQLGDRRILTVTAQEAMQRGALKNQTLAYFMARTTQFLTRIGVRPDWLRMRQHLANEMAHYASDCWDAEILTTHGWIEVVGHADRAAFDLNAHSEGSGFKLEVYEAWPESKWVHDKRVDAVLDASKIGATLRKRAPILMAALNELAAKKPAEALELNAKLEKEGKVSFTLSDGPCDVTREMASFKEVEFSVKGETVQPHVIEPAFGIGRIMYSVFEHSFRQRKVENDTEKRWFLALPPLIAPIKFSILPLVTSSEVQKAICTEIRSLLLEIGASTKLDNTNESIGRRYARTDEIGIPFGVTVDVQSEKDRTVTLRERDSCAQVRVALTGDNGLVNVARALLRGDAWEQVKARFNLPTFEANAEK